MPGNVDLVAVRRWKNLRSQILTSCHWLHATAMHDYWSTGM